METKQPAHNAPKRTPDPQPSAVEPTALSLPSFTFNRTPQVANPRQVLQLQRMIGNRATRSLIQRDVELTREQLQAAERYYYSNLDAYPPEITRAAARVLFADQPETLRSILTVSTGHLIMDVSMIAEIANWQSEHTPTQVNGMITPEQLRQIAAADLAAQEERGYTFTVHVDAGSGSTGGGTADAATSGSATRMLGLERFYSGHGWLSLTNTEGETITRGFYPLGEIGILGYVPGFIRNDGFETPTHSRSYPITLMQYNTVLTMIRRWERNTPDYSLTGRNCVGFVVEAARLIGIDLGETTWLGIFDPETLAATIERAEQAAESAR
jgi:hypothetical protein